MSKKKSFVFYYDWRDILEPLGNEMIGELMLAVLKYACDNEETVFENVALKISYNFIINTIKRDSEKYMDICEKRAMARKGKSLGNKNEIITNDNKCNQLITFVEDNDNDNDNVNDTENDKIISSSFSEKTACAYSEDFLLFWKEYPKKVGKGEAFRQWKKSRLTRADIADILNALKWQKRSSAWINSSGRFIPNPSTYISQRRWEDEPTEVIGTDITSPQSYNDGDDLPEFIMKGELQ